MLYTLFRIVGITTLAAVLSSYSVAGTAEQKTQAPNQTTSVYSQMYDKCPAADSFSKTMSENKFKPIIVSANDSDNVVVWINFKSDETVYTLSNGHKTCILFKGTHTVLNVPSGLTSI